MTTIRANCPQCGEVELPSLSIVLEIAPGEEEGTYTFVCPVCEQSVEKPADRRIVLLLRSAGVTIAEDDLDGATAERHGPPLTLDDLIDFHFMLQRDDWFADLLTPSESH